MEETKMNRSSFLDVRAKQQIDKYDYLNTYVINISDSDDLLYEDGVSDHNSFSVVFPDNQSSHIKNAKIRVKSVGLGTAGDGVDEASGFRIETNILKNSFNAKGRYGGHLGTFTITNRFLPESNVSKAGRATNVAGLLGDAQVGDIASKFSSSVFVNCVAPVGIPVDKGFYNCDNPFGKSVRFDFVDSNSNNFIDLGNDAAENTLIELEVILLPDNQANDKFSY